MSLINALKKTLYFPPSGQKSNIGNMVLQEGRTWTDSAFSAGKDGARSQMDELPRKPDVLWKQLLKAADKI